MKKRKLWIRVDHKNSKKTQNFSIRLDFAASLLQFIPKSIQVELDNEGIPFADIRERILSLTNAEPQELFNLDSDEGIAVRVTIE